MTSSIEKHQIGIDVSKHHLDVASYPSGFALRVENNVVGIGQLQKQLSSYSVGSILLEASGGYEREAVKLLRTMGYACYVVNPRLIRRFAQAMNCQAKTDKLDAQVLARYANTMSLPMQYIKSEQEQLQHDLQVRRIQLMKVHQQEQNRLEQAQGMIRETILCLLNAIEKQLASLDDEMMKLIRSDKLTEHKYECLRQIKGVGEKTANAFISLLPELGQLDRKRIAALVGVAPYNRDSGTIRGKRFVQGGRRAVRQALFMATLSAIRYNPAIKSFYQRLIASGKTKMTAFVAAMRKFIVIINAIVRDECCI